MYFRFTTTRFQTDSKSKIGIFQRSFELLNEESLPVYLVTGIREELDWFNENLSAPKIFDDNSIHLIPSDRAICWFKESATNHLTHCWTLVGYLRDAEILVDYLTTSNPGAILWEDEFQILAEPWRRHRDGVWRN